MTEYKVWIDQDLCTGDGLCAEIEPAIFGPHDDGLYYVKDEAWPNVYGPDGSSVDGLPEVRHGGGQTTRPDFVRLSPRLLDTAIEAAEECPGECIFINEVDG